MKLFKKFTIFILFILLTACDDMDGMCYNETDYGNSGDYDTQYLYPGNSVCTYDLFERISDFKQSQIVVSCLQSTTLDKAYSKSGLANEQTNKITKGNETKCSELADEIYDSDYKSDHFNNPDSVSDQDKQLILSGIFNACAELCVETCEKQSSSEDQWAKATLKTGSNYLGISLEENTVLNIKATGQVSLTDSATSTSIEFKKTGVEDVYRGLNDYLKNGDLAKVVLKINKAEAPSSSSLTDLKSRTYFGFKTYNPNLSSDAIGLSKHFYQVPDYSAVFCSYTEDTADCEFDYSKIINNSQNDSGVSNFISSLSSYYNLYYSTMVFNSLDNEQYSKYVNNSYNYITYDPNSSTLNTSDEDVFIGELSKTTSIVRNGILEGYVWNDSNESYTFTASGPFKLAIKYLGTDSSLNCKYTITYDDYVLTDKGNGNYEGETKSIVLNTSYSGASNRNNSGKYTWKTIKYVIDGDDNNSVKVENIFNRYSTINNPIEKKVVIRNVSGASNRELCSRGIAIKLLTLKDFKIKRPGLLFLAMPGIICENNCNNVGIKYKLINQNSLYTSSSSLNLTNKLQDFFETYLVGATDSNDSGRDDSMVYREIKVTSDDEIKAIKTGNDDKSIKDDAYESSVVDTINNLITNNKAIYVRSDQVIRFDYSNWMNIDGLENIEIKKSKININSGSSISNPVVETYFGTGLNVFIRENPAYMCYGTANESISMETKCGEKGGTYSNFEYVDDKNQTKQASVCFIEKDACLASASLVTKFKKIYADGNAPENSTMLNYYSYNAKSLTTFAAEVITEYYKYEDLSNLYPETDDSDKTEEQKKERKAAREAAINSSGLASNRHIYYYDTLVETYNQIKACYNAIRSGYTHYIGIPDKDGYEDYRKSLSSLNYTNSNNITIKKADGNAVDIINKNGDVVSFTISEDSDKKLAYDAIAKRIAELLQINKIIDTDNKTTNYTSNFYYYSNICEQTDGGNCKGEPVLQCYDLSNYKGSTKMLLNRVKTNNTASETEITNYGKLTAIDRAFGAIKINEYNGVGGLIKNFTAVSGEDDSDSFYSFQYKNNVTSSGLNFYSIYIINAVDYSGSYENAIKNSMKQRIRIGSATKTDPVIKLTSEARNSYQNGDRMAVILGENDRTYYSSNKSGEKNKIYYKENNNDYQVKDSSGNMVTIVGYNANGNLDEGSRYKFDLEGNLVKSIDNSMGFLFGDNDNKIAVDFLNYLGDSNYKNVFFRIVDVDEKLENNSGNYKLIINTYATGESQVISYFKDFFNKILTFVDGSYFKLKLDNSGNFKYCSMKDKEYCFIYNEEDVSENGNGCTVDDNNPNCFENCYLADNTVVCKEIYDGRGFVKNIFEMFINDPLYQFIAKIALVLAITLYGFTYFFGLSNFTQSEISMRLIRYAFIYMIISPSGWNFFNEYIIKFFKDGIDSLLFLIASAFDTDVNSSLYIASAAGNYSDKSMLFSSTFSNLDLIFSESIFNKMLGLAFSGWFGLIYLYLVLSGVLNYMVASFTAIILYLSAQLYMSLVFCFFPLVLLFMFFEKTKKTFDNWLGLLIGFAGQQLFLITTLSFFNLLVLTYIKMTFTYRVCLLPILNLNLGGIPLAAIFFWKIPSASFSNSISIMDENLPNFYTIISFYVITVLMGKFVTGMVEVGKSIFGGIGIGEGAAQTLTNGLSKASDMAKGSMKDLGAKFGKGMANRFLGGQAIEDYKKKQDKERKERKENREKFFKEHQKDVKDELNKYKNSEQFAKDLKEKESEKMSELKSSDKYKKASDSEKKRMEGKVRDDAAKDLLRDKEKEISYNKGVERVMNDKNMRKKLDDIAMKEQGKKFDDLSDEDKKDLAGRYAIQQGLVSEYKPKKPKPKPKPEPKQEPKSGESGKGGSTKSDRPSPAKPSSTSSSSGDSGSSKQSDSAGATDDNAKKNESTQEGDSNDNSTQAGNDSSSEGEEEPKSLATMFKETIEKKFNS